MKKDYETPEFDLLKIAITNIICDSKTEGAAGGGDNGEEGEFGAGG